MKEMLSFEMHECKLNQSMKQEPSRGAAKGVRVGCSCRRTQTKQSRSFQSEDPRPSAASLLLGALVRLQKSSNPRPFSCSLQCN